MLASKVKSSTVASKARRPGKLLTNSQTQELSLVLREVNRLGEASLAQLGASHHLDIGESVREATQVLVELNVLKETGNRQVCKYSLRSADEAGPKDFLILGSWKRVNVSKTGSRGVRVQTKLMAVRDGVTIRPCGSMIWSDKVSAPKYRLGPAERWDPLMENSRTRLDFETTKKENNDMAFRLSFQPALHAGETVDYGFYTWISNHFAMTRKEAVERYKDEWIREGMSVNDPSLYLQIKIGLPDGFHYDEARVEKNPVLTRDGPNVPGSIVRTYKPGQKQLVFESQRPTSGHYFVSWKPG